MWIKLDDLKMKKAAGTLADQPLTTMLIYSSIHLNSLFLNIDRRVVQDVPPARGVFRGGRGYRAGLVKSIVSGIFQAPTSPELPLDIFLTTPLQSVKRGMKLTVTIVTGAFCNNIHRLVVGTSSRPIWIEVRQYLVPLFDFNPDSFHLWAILRMVCSKLEGLGVEVDVWWWSEGWKSGLNPSCRQCWRTRATSTI